MGRTSSVRPRHPGNGAFPHEPRPLPRPRALPLAYHEFYKASCKKYNHGVNERTAVSRELCSVPLQMWAELTWRRDPITCKALNRHLHCSTPFGCFFFFPLFFSSVGGALDVASVELAADATPGAPPGEQNWLKVTVDLILNQSKSRKKLKKKTKKTSVACC